MKYFVPLVIMLGLALAGRPEKLPVVDGDTPVVEVLRALGEPVREDTRVRDIPGSSLELGRQIVLEGRLMGGKNQSAHFKCTSCHNVVREDPVLTVSDPETRLAYAEEHYLPFLPATTLWGAVNRETYYNGDYVKKYGDLVKHARNDLRGAIQLCATECAQGEALSTAEMESVVTYLHTIGLKLNDLPATAPSVEDINEELLVKSMTHVAFIKTLKANYSLASPAVFVLPPTDRKIGYAVSAAPDPLRGAALYDRACMHCHGGQRYSFFLMEKSEVHYRYLAKHFPKYDRYSTYQTVRYGTSPVPGKRAYMPHYTASRMSHLQVEDLRAFLEREAAK
ncbi:c-type cytochrome [Neolewinella antarctica]|uniref:Cytochrome c n=1 Tax=Neolewinella antarctica TaxID=442734 RepID=A0ABX0XDA1_9BACT|nr:c-type cytochrome [Neolewinella antarctica]NJC27187.1 cytochrome c [Neolewinella antarctica]